MLLCSPLYLSAALLNVRNASSFKYLVMFNMIFKVHSISIHFSIEKKYLIMFCCMKQLKIAKHSDSFSSASLTRIFYLLPQAQTDSVSVTTQEFMLCTSE